LVKWAQMGDFGERGPNDSQLRRSDEYSKSFTNATRHRSRLFDSWKAKVSVQRSNSRIASRQNRLKKLGWERSCWDCNVSGHPLDKYVKNWKTRTWNNKSMKERGTEKMGSHRRRLIEEIRELMTKKNEPMAFLQSRRSSKTPWKSWSSQRPISQFKQSSPPKNASRLRKISKRNGEISVLGRCGEVLDNITLFVIYLH